MVMPILDPASTVDASRPLPLGLSRPAAGSALDEVPEHRVNVAVFAPPRRRLEIVFQAPGDGWKVKPLHGLTDGVHHGIVDGLPPGTRYGFRATHEEDALPLSVPAGGVEDDARQNLPLAPTA